MSVPPEVLDVIRQWVRKAEHDLEAARRPCIQSLPRERTSPSRAFFGQVRSCPALIEAEQSRIVIVSNTITRAVMAQLHQCRRVLPVVQTGLAALLGGLGLWQRNEILSHSWGGWNSTGRFHVWPWPFKFAVISNMPAFLAGSLLSWPMANLLPGFSEPAQLAPCLLFVPALWYWVGSRLDRRLPVMAQPAFRSRSNWSLLLLFTLLCAMGASIPIGYTGYLPYGIALWVMMGFTVRYVSKAPANSPKATEHKTEFLV